MSTEDIAFCSICQITFGSHEEVHGHKCLQINVKTNKYDNIKNEEGKLSERKNKMEDNFYTKPKDKALPVTRLKIFDSLRARKINPSAEFIQEAIEFVLQEYGLVMDQLTDNSMASLYKNVEQLRKNLRRRVKGAKYDEFRKNYLVSYLQIPFTFDLEIRDDLGDLGNFAENNSANDKKENNQMINDHDKNDDDFLEMSSKNDEVIVETNEYQDEEQNKDSSNFELSERFISFIIQQVHELCEYIKTGDPDTKRTMEVNRKLNNAVDCYIIKLENVEPENVEPENVETENVEPENVEPAKDEPIKVEPETVEPENVEPEKDEPEKVEPENVEPENVESEIFEYHYDEIGIESGNKYDTKYVLHDSKVPEKKEKKSKAPKDKKTDRGKSKAINDENIQPEKIQCIRKGTPQKRRIDEKFELVKVLEEKVEKPKVPEENKKAKSRGPKRKKSNDENLELVKNQCGRHSVSSMALILNMTSQTIRDRIKKDGITFTKKVMECQLCDMKRNTVDLKRDALHPFLRFNSNENKFECLICVYSCSGRDPLYKHIRSKHRNEIIAKVQPDRMSDDNQDCDGSVCQKTYGLKGKRFWCKKCLKKLQLDEEKRKEPRVCPECGVSVQQLTRHLNDVHPGEENREKHICNVCSLECSSLYGLNQHKRKVHEKAPCTQCGKLFGGKYLMKRHIQSAHTTDDQKKYICDTCGKGFIDNQRLSEHLNIHTGEKPFKCKLCPASFASKGTHAMHERTVHLGHSRYISEDQLEARNVDDKNTTRKKILNKKYSCQICSKTFIDTYKLKRHAKVHVKTGELTDVEPLNEKPLNFICQICDKSFIDNWKLKRHEKVHIKAGELTHTLD